MMMQHDAPSMSFTCPGVLFFILKIHPAGKLTWNLKTHQIEQENHLPHLHFCVQNVNFPGNVTSPAILAP